MMSSRPASLAVKAFGMPRAGRPEKARVITVRSWRAARIACLCAAGAPDSGHVRNAVPSCAAAAPRVSAAVIARPSMIPPEAITGTRTAAAIPATRSSIGTIATSKGAANVPRCAPASAPCATTASTPASASMRPSRTVVAVPRMAAPLALTRAIASLPGMPKVKLKMAGRAASTASSCASNGSGGTAGTVGAGRPKAACASASSASIAAGSTAFAVCHAPANRFTLKGRSVSALIRRTASVIWSGVRYAAPSEPSPPAFETAATSSGVDGPPPIGPWMIGHAIPSLRKNSFAAIRTQLLFLCRRQTRLGRAKLHEKWFIVKEAIGFRDGGGRRSGTMDTGDLTVFAAVAQAGGITKAAQRLNTVQSNVTQRVRLLEAELGVPLFHRHSRGVSLTSAGRQLLPYAERIGRLMAEAKQAAADTAVARGQIVIGTSAALLEAVRDRHVEAAFVAGPVDHAELIALPLLEEELVVVTAPWLAALDDVVAAAPLKIVVFRPGCTYRLRLEALLAARGAVGVRRLEFGTLDGIIGCVGAGIGVTLLPRAAVAKAAAEGRVALHALPAREARVPTVLVRRADCFLSTALSRFIETARRHLVATPQPAPARGRQRQARDASWISF